MTRRLFYPDGSLAGGGDRALVTPKLAGWTYCGLRVLELEAGASRILTTGTAELAVLPLAGSFVVECESHRFDLAGRDDVFSRVSDFAYAPIDAEVRITAPYGGRVALPSAQATRRLDPAYGPASNVPVEVRGGGQASRQINNFLEPSAFPADKLVAVEVLTPDGNWSSFPPHKHDEQRQDEAQLEEIYYFEIAGGAGFGVHRLYTRSPAGPGGGGSGEIDVTETVRSGDVFLIPRGYHGPSIAAPGHHMYYLNVLAGPAPERTMRFCDDPAHAWLRDELAARRADPRLPMTSSDGRVAR